MFEQPTISLEFGHTVLDSSRRDPSAIAQVHLSSVAARYLVTELRKRGFHVQTFVLVDDKHATPGADRDVEIGLLLDAMEVLPDELVFESELATLAPGLIVQIDEPRASRLAIEIERRTAKAKMLACSVDISIWHALRLGLLHDSVDSETPSQVARALLARVKPADIAVSILSSYDRPYEDRAWRENLSSIDGLDRGRIRNIYVQPSSTRSDVLASAASVLDELTEIRIGGIHA